MSKTATFLAAPLALAAALTMMPGAANAGAKISNDLSRCSGSGPAVLVNIAGLKSRQGKLRVQSYRGTKTEWLKKGAWLHRVELPVSGSSMKVCLPVPSSGTYGIAVRHDVNGNGSTDLSKDGGGMSGNPSINVFNLGKPSYKKTAFQVGNSVKSITIDMKYM